MIGAIGWGGAAAWQQLRYVRAAASASAAEPEAPSSAAAAAKLEVSSPPAFAAAAAALASPELPYIPKGYGPEELAARTRLQFPASGFVPSGASPWQDGDEAEQDGVSGIGVDKSESPAEVMDDARCETCEKRKYQDGSDDPGVSFKTAQRVDPDMAQAAVRGHEQEHVFRERAEAEREGRKVVIQSVTYHTGICPECGRFYISGGTTRTVTAADNTKGFFDELRDGEDPGAGLDTTA